MRRAAMAQPGKRQATGTEPTPPRRMKGGAPQIAVGLALLAALVVHDAAAQQKSERPTLVALYQTFHANPELSFHEVQSAARLAEELTALGAEVTVGVGGHGVVGVLRNGAGPVVMLRTDLDALPVAEETPLAFKSIRRATQDDGRWVGVMHACGHDVHMTNLIGAARELAKRRAEWSGTLVLIGQPAEERGAGARAMLEDGLFERFPKPDYALAVHVKSDLAAGTIAFSGSLYLLVLTDTRWFGAITPIGGTLLIVGWVALALRARPLEVSPST